MNENYLNELELLLSQNETYTVEGKVNKNKVAELAHKYDPELIDRLAGNAGMRRLFFVETAGKVLVFNKDRFIQFISNKEFLPDSYTSYKNKIGLGSGTDMLAENKEVVLNWPYKDCVLEGGQDKEDAKRDEVFFNEVLAPEQIDRLLAEKVLTGWKLYDKDGEHEVKDFADADNLLIRGNNLLALHSLKHRYGGKAKLIYLDPPYNTGSDSFGYNDKFRLSTWLTFIRNRVQAATKLLNNDGVLVVQCSFHNFAYLQALLDEFEGSQQLYRVMYFNVLARHPERALTADKEFNDVVEHVLVYSKSPNFKMPKIQKDKLIDEYVYEVKTKSKGKAVKLQDKEVIMYTPDEWEMVKGEPSAEKLKTISIRGSIKEKNSSGRFFVKYLEPVMGDYPPMTLFRVEGMGDDGLGYRYMHLPKNGNKNGTYFQGSPLSSDVTEIPHANFLDYVEAYNRVNDQGNVELRNAKKPEELMMLFVDLFSGKGELVIDFFVGSGTTAAVALKMGRRFIGVEQLEYIDSKTVPRLQNVINGDQTGISSDVSWSGGGNFVYAHLMDLGNKFIEKVKKANTDKELEDLLAQASKSSFLSYKVDPAKINPADHDFASLSLAHKKQLLLELVDQNHLYVNYTEIDDADYGVSANDKKLNKQFYEK